MSIPSLRRVIAQILPCHMEFGHEAKLLEIERDKTRPVTPRGVRASKNSPSHPYLIKDHRVTGIVMATHNLRPKRARSPEIRDAKSPVASPSQAITLPESPIKSKKLKLHSSFVVESPFPQFAHPTPAEALEVFQLLSNAHRTHDPVRKPPVASNNSAQTCGSVPNVIETLISTILSQNTSGKNSSRAKAALDAAFGRNNFAAIFQAPRDDLVDAIRSGGLANKKAATIQNILRSIKTRHGEYSLQHLGTEEEGKRMSDDEIMKELLSYDGVGPKTASCVLLFCLGRDSFAVDTHVFRLSKVLGWVPPQADRILTQAHLDLRVPGELKYGLHVLMIQHGRVCRGCKTSASGESCILKTYLKEQNLRSRGTEIKEELESAQG